LKKRGFSGYRPGTESARRVGFGGGFGVKVAVLWAGESGLSDDFRRQQALQIAKETEPEGFRSY
jgi:hypothetical protein